MRSTEGLAEEISGRRHKDVAQRSCRGVMRREKARCGNTDVA
jgi:hypothetical protein